MTDQTTQLQSRLENLKQQDKRVKARIHKINSEARRSERKHRNSRLIRISKELFNVLGREPTEEDVVRMKRFAQKYQHTLKNQFNTDAQLVEEIQIQNR